MEIKVKKIEVQEKTKFKVGDIVELDEGKYGTFLWLIVEEIQGYILRTFIGESWVNFVENPGTIKHHTTLQELQKTVESKIIKYYSREDYNLVLERKEK